MKKIYVMVAFLGASSFAFNQVQEAASQVTLNTEKAISSNTGAVKAQGTSLWDNDFSVPGDWVIGTGGNGVQGTWVIGTEADFAPFVFQGQNVTLSNFMNDPSMTTYTNGFAFFDGIQFNDNTLEQNSWIAMANGVDCTGENTVTLKFEQEYRGFSTNKTYVEVSLDGGATWEQTIDVNSTVASNANASEQLVYRNFNVNGYNDVKFRFRWESLATAGGYGWQVDDVEVLTLADNDISTSNHSFGSEGLYYHQIPLAQVAPIEGSVMAKNEGSADQANVKFNAVEASGAYTSSSAAQSLVSGATDSLVLANTFTPSATGSYKIDYSISYDNTDDVPSNNALKSYKFTVGQNIYARDSSTNAQGGTAVGSLSGSNTGEQAEFGNLYDIWAPAQLTAIDFQFGSIISDGALVYGQVYEYPTFDPVPNNETQAYITQAGDAGKYRTLVFDTPLNLDANKTYAVTVKSFDVNFSVSSRGASPAQTSHVFYPGEDTWYYITSTPVVRMNFDPSVSLENNELSNLNVTQNFPNPFANETTVELNLKEAAEVSYTVVDLTGKVIANVNEGNVFAGDHSITIDGTSFANGVYYLNIKAGESSVTRKIVVNK